MILLFIPIVAACLFWGIMVTVGWILLFTHIFPNAPIATFYISGVGVFIVTFVMVWDHYAKISKQNV